MKPKILGTYKVTNKISIYPDKKCIDCLFFDEGLCWCRWLKKKILTWDYYDECPVNEITVEEI